MKKVINILVFLLVAKFSAAGIQVQSFVVIEQDAFNAKQIEFWIEDSQYKYSFDKLQREIYNGRFINTNICGYIENFSGKGDQIFVIRLTTEDSIYTLRRPFYIDSNITLIKNEILIGHKGNQKSFLKGFTVNKFINSSNEILISSIKNLKIGESPLFQIQNNTQDTLYPKTCMTNEKEYSNNYFGVLYFEKSSSSFSQVSPYKFCLKPTEKETLCPSDTATVFVSNGIDCTLFPLQEKGRYYIIIDLVQNENGTDSIQFPFFRVFTKYRVKYDFEVIE